MGNMTEFLVTPEVLLQSAQRMEDSLRKAERPVTEWEDTAKETEKYLKGKAGEAFRKKADLIAVEWQQQMEKLCGVIVQLREIADTYKVAEGENADVIYRTTN